MRDKIKIEISLKGMLVISFVIYAAIQNLDYFNGALDPLLQASIKQKNIANKHFEIVITGGSNAFFGISAKKITDSDGASKAYNFAISGAEGAGYLNYADWLKKKNISANMVIYSSMNFWYLNEGSPFEKLPDENFSPPEKSVGIKTPMATKLRGLFTRHYSIDINSNGDIENFPCNETINEFPTRLIINAAPKSELVEKLTKKMSEIKSSLNTPQIYFRIPPLYIEEKERYKFMSYINKAKEALEKKGMKFIDQNNILTFSKYDMCFGPNHPTHAHSLIQTEDLFRNILLLKAERYSGVTSVNTR